MTVQKTERCSGFKLHNASLRLYCANGTSIGLQEISGMQLAGVMRAGRALQHLASPLPLIRFRKCRVAALPQSHCNLVSALMEYRRNSSRSITPYNVHVLMYNAAKRTRNTNRK